MTVQENKTVVHQWADAVNRDDPDAFRACLAPKIQWTNMADGRVVHGAEHLRQAIRGHVRCSSRPSRRYCRFSQVALRPAFQPA